LERTVSTLSIGSYEMSERRGFLPATDPLRNFGEDAHPNLKYLEELGKQLPELLEGHKLRGMVETMKPFDQEVFLGLDRPGLVMAARIYAFLTSAYVHQLDEPKIGKVPRSLAVPFAHLSKKLGRKFPILSYDLYALNNWRLKEGSSIKVDNMDTIQKFVKLRDEPWFILVHVEIESEAGPAVAAIGKLQQAVMRKDVDGAGFALQTISESLDTAITTLSRMPEGNSPDLYAFTFRPYIQMFDGVRYEGVGEFGRMPVFRGETGAQSSVIPSLDIALGVKHARTGLTDYVADMRNYMPAPHREFIREAEKNEAQRPVRKFVADHGKSMTARAYNLCLDRIIQFRQKHLEFAVNYIFTKVDDPSGTGGTPFMEWLAQLRDETAGQKLPV
jgi:indoleamine 2,3-dioxygenase